MSHGESAWVNADPTILMDGWQHDPWLREDVYRRILALKRQGELHLDIARRIGVSSRTVDRVLNPKEPRKGAFLCGAPRHGGNETGSEGKPCQKKVAIEGTRCYQHQ